MKKKLKLLFSLCTLFCFFCSANTFVNVTLLSAKGNHDKAAHISPDVLKKELIELEKNIKGFSLVFEKVAELIGPSVVKIKITRETEPEVVDKEEMEMKPHFPNQFFKPFEKNSFNPHIADNNPKQDIGSGVIIDERGYIVTNNHVVGHFTKGKIVVTLYDGKELEGKIIGVDPKTDLAVIKIDGMKFQAAEFGDISKMSVGDWVIAVGSPFNYQQTVSAGIISAIGRKGVNPRISPFAYEDFIQTDASINPGSSGGPLVNLRGEIIGINSAIATRSGGFQGIGFAISEVIVQQVAKELIGKGFVRRGFIGVGMMNIDDKLAKTLGLTSSDEVMKYLKLNSRDGAYIVRVWDNTPATHASLIPGDIILEMDDKIITDAESLQYVIRDLKIDETVEILVMRNGQKLHTVITIGEQPENMEGIGFTTILSRTLNVGYGLVVQQLNPKNKKQTDSDKTSGVHVVAVERESISDKAGIKVGDIISKIGSNTISSLADFYAIFSELKNENKPITLEIKSKGIVTLIGR